MFDHSAPSPAPKGMFALMCLADEIDRDLGRSIASIATDLHLGLVVLSEPSPRRITLDRAEWEVLQ
ncbi:hypothetical protein SAMN04244548_01214 [Paracoccus pantotrophus]|nr:hypothetical protein SAMN04244548_01214 [Paracoccus pantotrophus]